MMKALKTLLWLLALAAILAGGWQGARLVQAQRESAPEAREETQEVENPEVATVEVETGSVAVNVWVTGEARPLKSVEIVPNTSGRLERFRLPDGTPIEEGVEVEKGDEVAAVEHRQLLAAVRSAKASLAAATAARETAEVNAADARRERERWAELRRGGSGTQQQVDKSVTACDSARAQLSQAEAKIGQAEAAT